ncbi:hypothetical protein JHK82_027940 [Glycine max]|nr:hypothetical protein JHK82_027940 [Glycine max]KAG5151719.1 hypothetical protein JHK84_028191 [Glycine max]
MEDVFRGIPNKVDASHSLSLIVVEGEVFHHPTVGGKCFYWICPNLLMEAFLRELIHKRWFSLIVLYVVFKLDESYTPSKVSILAGDGFHNLKEIKTVELVKPTGWVYLSLSGADPR